MWLINTQTLKLKFFLKPPLRYSILSHVWTDEECSFQEFRSLEEVDEPILAITGKKGFKKIQACCKLSLEQGFEWTWVDTCCIDKSSSAELSESINSMFSWYQSSSMCYAYLDDIESTSPTGRRVRKWQPDSDSDLSLDSDSDSDYTSRWYSRGWTLQELIAPLNVDFYSRSWTRIGSKWGLRREISSITGVGEADLVVFDPRRSSVAQKMSWASKRKTTRVEDEAYCLLGLFGVHMPLLYGEGKNAFRRLQEELIRTSTDHTIFAWWDNFYIPSVLIPRTLLADSPRDFRKSDSIVTYVWAVGQESYRRAAKKTYVMTNGGLEIELPIVCDVEVMECHFRKKHIRERHLFTIGLLNCRDTKFQGLIMGFALKAEGSGTFRVHGQPFSLSPNIEFEIKTVVLALDHLGDAVLLPRSHLTSGFNLSTIALRYRGQIFVAKDLLLDSVCQVACPDVSDYSAAARFVHPTRDQISSENSTKVEVTADGFYWFQVQRRRAFESLVLNLSTGPSPIISLQLLLSPAPYLLPNTLQGFHHEQLSSLTCRVWATGTPACEVRSAAGEEDSAHTSYERQLGRVQGQDGVWFEHVLPDGRTLEVSVVNTTTSTPWSEFWGEILYFGLKGA